MPVPDFLVGFSPERIDPGNLTWDFQRTPKLVSGIDANSREVVDGFYRTLVDATVPMRGTREAELAKLLENTFRHVNIALVNELAMLARSLDIDFWDVIDGASTKPFGFMPFRPGPGVGGHCLPVDPSYLSWQFERRLGSVSRFVKIANDVNNTMPTYVAGRVQAGLNGATEAGERVEGAGVGVGLQAQLQRCQGDAGHRPDPVACWTSGPRCGRSTTMSGPTSSTIGSPGCPVLSDDGAASRRRGGDRDRPR